MEYKHGITIYKEELDDDVIDTILSELTFINPQYAAAVERGNKPVIKVNGVYKAIPKYTYFVREFPNRIEVPLGYLDRLQQLLGFGNEFRHPPQIHKLPPIELRDYQEESIIALLGHQTGILSSPAASGKTVIGIALADMLELKTLWLVHRAGLARQAAKSYTKLTGNESGFVGDKSWEIGDLFTAGVTKTVSLHTRELEKEGFDLIIVDEVHRAPTSTTFNALIGLSPKILYGLSATPYREDGLEEALYSMIGPIRHNVSRAHLEANNYIVTPDIHIVATNVSIDLDMFETLSFGAYLKALKASQLRTANVMYEVMSHYSLDKYVLILTEHVDYCEFIYEVLSKLTPNAGIIHGRNKKLEKELRQRIEDKTLKLICSTYRYFSDGFDIPELDVIVFATPFKSKIQTEQTIGRVQRICANKTNAVVIDLVDDDPIARKHLTRRMSVYKQLKCKWRFKSGQFKTV